MNFEKEVVRPATDQLSLKDDTNIGDIVLIFKEKQCMFGIVLDIVKNINNHHQEWWDVTFKVLSIPLLELTWTLRTDQMIGKEVFTMSGANMFFAPIDVNSSVSINPFHKMVKVKPALKLVDHPEPPSERVIKKGSKKGLLRLVVDNTKK